MNTQRRQWQTSVYRDSDLAPEEALVTIYGATLAQLAANFVAWMVAKQPPVFWFQEIRGKSLLQSTPVKVFPAQDAGYYDPPFLDDATERQQVYKAGDWVLERDDSWSGWGGENDVYATIEEAARAIAPILDFKKGPDFQDLALQDGGLSLHLIRKTVQVGTSELTNELLTRGWYIIGRNVSLEQDFGGTAQTTYFILGHPDEDAR